MKSLRLFFPSLSLLFILCNNFYSIKINSLSPENDTLSAVYNKIPENGVLHKWLVLGPIPVNGGKGNSKDQTVQMNAFDTDYISPGKVLKSISVNKQVINNTAYNWKTVESYNPIIDLTQLIGDTSFVSAYAYAQVNVPDEQDLLLGLGSDDGVKMWVNQKLVHTNWIGRGIIIDNDLIPLKLKKGKNEILIKIQNMEMRWGFSCRVIPLSELSSKLFTCIKAGDVQNVSRLLKYGVDINSLSDLGLTPLQTAHVYGQKVMEKFLRENGADSTNQMPSKEKLVDNLFNNILKYNYPGAAVLISRDGKILYEKAYGYSNLEDEVIFKVDSKFRIASITKQFTAAAILKLQECGALSVNDTVSKFLPDVPRGNEITIKQLLTHSSGLQRDWNEGFFKSVPIAFTPEFMKNEIKKLKYDFIPGERWGYSNCGYYILSQIIEKVSGLSYDEFLKKNLFEPLKMINTGVYYWNTNVKYEALKNEVKGYTYENGKYYKTIVLDEWDEGAGNLYSTLEDLFKWNEALYNNKILTESSLKAALAPVEFKDPKWKMLGFDYGFGLFMRQYQGIKDISHSGGLTGYESHLCWLPEKNINIIVFLNRFPFPPEMNTVTATEEVAQIYLWEELLQSKPTQAVNR